MKLAKLLPVVVLTLSVFTVQAQHTNNPSLVAQGAKVYSENCGRCHNARPAEEYSKKEWSVVVPHMRAKAHMTGTEALAVEAFLDSTLTAEIRSDNHNINKNDEPQRTGAELVAAFGCQGCHTIKGEGGALGPNLDKVIATKGEAFVLKKLTNPKFNNAASAMPKYPMSDADKQAIINFLKE